MNSLALVLARIFKGETRDTSGRLFGDDLDALDDSGDNFVFDARVKSLGVLAHDDQIDARIARGNVRKIADRAEIGEEFEALAQFNVDAGESATDGRGYRAFQSDARTFDRFGQLLRDVFFVFFKCFGAGGEAFPFELDAGRFEHANCGLYDFRADSVAGD